MFITSGVYTLCIRLYYNRILRPVHYELPRLKKYRGYQLFNENNSFFKVLKINKNLYFVTGFNIYTCMRYYFMSHMYRQRTYLFRLSLELYQSSLLFLPWHGNKILKVSTQQGRNFPQILSIQVHNHP